MIPFIWNIYTGTFTETDSRLEAARGCRGGALLPHEDRVSLWGMKTFWKCVVVVVLQHCSRA